MNTCPKFICLLALASLLPASFLLGCQCSVNPGVGSVKALQNEVWQGSTPDNLSLVPDQAQDLHNGDTLRIKSGGEALLDFQNQMIVHLYNDSQAQVISAHPDPNTPLDVRMRLEDGGLVGIVNDHQGGQAVFETPGGGTLYITGTRFFIYYEPYNQYLLAGNFEGSIRLERAEKGAEYPITPGSYILYQPGKEIIEMTLPANLDVLSFMKTSAARGIEGVASQLLETALASPADLQLSLVSIRPEELQVGDCPNMTNTTQAVATVSGYAERVWIKWALNDQIEIVEMKQIQTGTYRGDIGPVTTSGTLYVYIYAQDKQGRIAQIGPFTIQAIICIG